MGPLSNLQRRARELFGLDGPPGPTAAAAAPLPPVPSTPGPGWREGGAGASDPDAVRCRSARREDLRPAVRAILSSPGRPVDDAHADEFLRSAASRRLDVSRLRVADRRGRVVWAVLPVPSPGQTALLLTPPIPPGPADQAAAGALLDHVAAELAAGGIRLAQTLLDPTDAAGRAAFAARGFAEMAELIYLAGEPRRKALAPLLPPGFSWVGYTDPPVPGCPPPHELFKQTIAASYEQSLDCPALNGVRDMEDVIAGHQASGEFDPRLWRVLVGPGDRDDPAADGEAGVPLGVLLLAPIPQADAVELVYLGLVPAARGRRLGDLLVRQAVADAAAAGAQRLTLAVDAANAPALKLYYRHGLARVGAKVAMMRDLAARGPG